MTGSFQNEVKANCCIMLYLFNVIVNRVFRVLKIQNFLVWSYSPGRSHLHEQELQRSFSKQTLTTAQLGSNVISTHTASTSYKIGNEHSIHRTVLTE